MRKSEQFLDFLHSLWLRSWMKLYTNTSLFSITVHFIRPVEYMTFEVRQVYSCHFILSSWPLLQHIVCGYIKLFMCTNFRFHSCV